MIRIPLDPALRTLIANPLVRAQLGTEKDWTALCKAEDVLTSAAMHYRNSRASYLQVADLGQSLADTLIAGRKIPNDFHLKAGNATRAQQDSQAALDAVTAAADVVLARREEFVRAWARNAWAAIDKVLTSTVTNGRYDSEQLGGSTTIEAAARLGRLESWTALEAAHRTYMQARQAQDALLIISGHGDEQSNMHRLFANAADLFPEWEREGHRVIDPDTHETIEIISRPWPEPVESFEHFRWVCCHAEAEPWVPTPSQLAARTSPSATAA